VFVETNTLTLLMPEIILVLMATWIFVAGTFASSRTWWAIFALCSYLVAGYALYIYGRQFGAIFDAGDALGPRGPVGVDMLGYVLRCLALGVGLLSTLMVTHSLRKNVACETLGMIMLAVAGVMIVAQATDLVMLFVGLELVSIPTYVLLYIGRPGREGAEATAKYFYLSILSSAMLLYGFSFLYGMTGTTTLFGNASIEVPGIRDQLMHLLAKGDSLTSLAPLALVLIFAGLGFKMAAVPFHFYAPDVYQGTTNVNAGLLAVLPKIAGGVVLLRLGVVCMPQQFASYAWQFMLVIAILTMTLGNVCALWQTNLRRMMGYSSIAHAGYMLIGLTVAIATQGLASGQQMETYGMSAMVFYLIIYAIGSLGTFAVLSHLSSEQREVSTIEEIAGLNKSRPVAAGLLAVFMFSLAGIPPLAGFWGKLTLFWGAVETATIAENAQLSNWMIVLAVAGALNAAIAGGYYLRIVGAMYFQPGNVSIAEPGGWGGLSAAVICGVLTVLLGLSPGFVLSSTRKAEKSAHRLPSATSSYALEGIDAAPVASR
jgi:NADH-quinone oxidoreductase subunit N